MIARMWHGETLEENGEMYLEYLKSTGVKECRATVGNQGVLVFTRRQAGKAEFLFVSLWESLEAIQRFAGEDIEKAVYFPEDTAFLLELEPQVNHFELSVASLPELG